MKNKKLEELSKRTFEYSSLIKAVLDKEGVEKQLKKRMNILEI